jgi:hypothetical protein
MMKQKLLFDVVYLRRLFFLLSLDWYRWSPVLWHHFNLTDTISLSSVHVDLNHERSDLGPASHNSLRQSTVMQRVLLPADDLIPSVRGCFARDGSQQWPCLSGFLFCSTGTPLLCFFYLSTSS